jgi:hypothetical protein
MKNSNDTIGNGTRDLMACSAVPQPSPRAPLLILLLLQLLVVLLEVVVTMIIKCKNKVTVYTMKAYWMTRNTYPVILNQGNRLNRWSGRLALGKYADTHRIRDWLGPQSRSG